MSGCVRCGLMALFCISQTLLLIVKQNGSLPLHLAAVHGNLPAVRFYVEECGVSVDVRDKVCGEVECGSGVLACVA